MGWITAMMLLVICYLASGAHLAGSVKLSNTVNDTEPTGLHKKTHAHVIMEEEAPEFVLAPAGDDLAFSSFLSVRAKVELVARAKAAAKAQSSEHGKEVQVTEDKYLYANRMTACDEVKGRDGTVTRESLGEVCSISDVYVAYEEGFRACEEWVFFKSDDRKAQICDTCGDYKAADGECYRDAIKNIAVEESSTIKRPVFCCKERQTETASDENLESIIEINFGPEDAGVPEGWQLDKGEQFGDRDNGLFYGWSCDEQANVMQRHEPSGLEVYDTTLIQPYKGGSCPQINWEIALPNQGYMVTLRYSDPKLDFDTAGCALEGLPAGVGLAAKGVPAETEIYVRLTDGLLTFMASADDCKALSSITIRSVIDFDVQFGPADTVMANDEHHLDIGSEFGPRDKSMFYGWSCNQEEFVVQREEGSTSEDTALMELEKNSECEAELEWDVAVPKGTYDVTVTFGDPDRDVSTEACAIEGKSTNIGVVKKGTTATFTTTVDVDDDLLTFEAEKQEVGWLEGKYSIQVQTPTGVIGTVRVCGGRRLLSSNGKHRWVRSAKVFMGDYEDCRAGECDFYITPLGEKDDPLFENQYKVETVDMLGVRGVMMAWRAHEGIIGWEGKQRHGRGLDGTNRLSVRAESYENCLRSNCDLNIIPVRGVKNGYKIKVESSQTGDEGYIKALQAHAGPSKVWGNPLITTDDSFEVCAEGDCVFIFTPVSGWELAMRIQAGAKQFLYDDPLWTNTHVVPLTPGGTAKTASYFKPFVELKIVTRWPQFGNQPSEVILPLSGNSLHEVMNSDEPVESGLAVGSWHELLPPAFRRSYPAVASQGINVENGPDKARIGVIFSTTPGELADGAQGMAVGAGVAAKLGAKAGSGSIQSPGSPLYLRPIQTEIWVQTGKAEADGSPKFHMDAARGNAATDFVGKRQFAVKPDCKNAGSCAPSIVDGVRAWNWEKNFLVKTHGPPLIIAKEYTIAMWVNMHEGDSLARTFFAGRKDDIFTVQATSHHMGYQYNRGAKKSFVDTGFTMDVTGVNDRDDGWQLVVVTGKSNNDAKKGLEYGVGKVFVGTEGDNQMEQKGNDMDMVATGEEVIGFGRPGAFPGKVSELLYWERVLDFEEIQQLWIDGQEKYFSEWELAMRVDGGSTAFNYDSPKWTQSKLYTSKTQLKTEAFNQPFSSLRLKVYTTPKAGPPGSPAPQEVVNEIILAVAGESLHQVFTDDQPIRTRNAVSDWRQLIPGGNWDVGCNKQGINIFNGNFDDPQRVRIGIMYSPTPGGRCADNNILVGIGLHDELGDREKSLAAGILVSGKGKNGTPDFEVEKMEVYIQPQGDKLEGCTGIKSVRVETHRDSEGLNSLANPDFELDTLGEGTTQLQITPAGWVEDTTSTSGGVYVTVQENEAWDKLDSASGDHFVVMDQSGTCLEQILELEAETEYEVAFTAARKSDDEHALLTVYQETDGVVTTLVEGFTPTAIFEEYGAVFTTASDTEIIVRWCLSSVGDVDDVWVAIDDVIVEDMIVANGDFELDTLEEVKEGYLYQAPVGWTAIGSVAMVENGNKAWGGLDSLQNKNYLALEDDGAVEQELDLVQGQKYILTFYAASRPEYPDAKLTVEFANRNLPGFHALALTNEWKQYRTIFSFRDDDISGKLKFLNNMHGATKPQTAFVDKIYIKVFDPEKDGCVMGSTPDDLYNELAHVQKKGGGGLFDKVWKNNFDSHGFFWDQPGKSVVLEMNPDLSTFVRFWRSGSDPDNMRFHLRKLRIEREFGDGVWDDLSDYHLDGLQPIKAKAFELFTQTIPVGPGLTRFRFSYKDGARWDSEWWVEGCADPNAPARGAKVTCKFTVDNVVDKVYYHDQDITWKVAGNMQNWGIMKYISFRQIEGAALSISGHNSEPDLGPRTCRSGGFILGCTSEDPDSVWEGYVSDETTVLAYGSHVATAPDGAENEWWEGDFDATGWKDACVSTSGFSGDVGFRNAEKMWGSDKYSFFKLQPDIARSEEGLTDLRKGALVTCKLKANNEIKEVYYNDKSLTHSLHSGPGASQVVYFHEIEHEVLGIHATDSETGSCRTGGLIYWCTSDDPKADWHNYGSEVRAIVAKGADSPAEFNAALSSILQEGQTWYESQINDESWQDVCESMEETLNPTSLGAPPGSTIERVWGSGKHSYFRIEALRPVESFEDEEAGLEPSESAAAEATVVDGDTASTLETEADADAAYALEPIVLPERVTCRFTGDNIVHKVYYNGVDLTSKVAVVDLKNWGTHKMVDFLEVEGGFLSIEMENVEKNDHHERACRSAGMIMYCEAINEDSDWHEFKTEAENFRAWGEDTRSPPSPDWYKDDYNDYNWWDQCTSTSGFSYPALTAKGAEKVWGSGVVSYFRFQAGRVIPPSKKTMCQLAGYDKVRAVYYNGLDMTSKTYTFADSPQITRFYFHEETDATLAYAVEANNPSIYGARSCFSDGGMYLNCRGGTTDSQWEGFVSSKQNVAAYGTYDYETKPSDDWYENDIRASWQDYCPSDRPQVNGWGALTKGVVRGSAPGTKASVAEPMWGQNRFSYFRANPKDDTPDYELGSLVKCKIFANNKVTSVFYNDRDLTKSLFDLAGHPKIKQLWFYEVDGAYLSIEAEDYSHNAGTCRTGRIEFRCESDDPTSVWHHYVSDPRDLVATGSDTKLEGDDADWYLGETDDSEWQGSCTSYNTEATPGPMRENFGKKPGAKDVSPQPQSVWGSGKFSYFRIQPSRSNIPVLDRVQCIMTADNAFVHIYYNGEDKKDEVAIDNLNSWQVQKMVDFIEVDGGYLSISAMNSENDKGPAACRSGGFLMSCTSLNEDSKWHGFTSSHLTVRAWGMPSDSPPSSTWYANDYDDTDWWDQCEGSSNVALAAAQTAGAQKVWSGAKYGFFRMNPYVEIPPSKKVTCKLTVDDTLHAIYYDGHDLSHKVSGDFSNWQSLKEFTFNNNDGGVLAFYGEAKDKRPAPKPGQPALTDLPDHATCRTSGMVLNCHSDDPESIWYEYVSKADNLWARGLESVDLLAGDADLWYKNDFTADEWTDNCPSFDTRVDLGPFHPKPRPPPAPGAPPPPPQPVPQRVWGANKFTFFRVQPKSTMPTFKTVTCQMTADNAINAAYYNNEDVTDLIRYDDLRASHDNKILTFHEVEDAFLSVSTENFESHTDRRQACSSAAFVVSCTSLNPKSEWHKWVSASSNLKALGRSSNSPPAGWYEDTYDDTKFSDVCDGGHGFPQLSGGAYYNPSPVWGSSKYSFIRMQPGRSIPAINLVTCRIVADNVLNAVYYDDRDITYQVEGSRTSWTAAKVVRFAEIDGATLSVMVTDNEQGSGRTSGFMMYCTATDTSSKWHNWVSAPTNLAIKGIDTPTVPAAMASWYTSNFDDAAFVDSSRSYQLSLANPLGKVPNGVSTPGGVWGSKKTALIRILPGRQVVPHDDKVSCFLTGDNVIHKIYYNGVDITPEMTKNPGNPASWPQMKMVTFTEVTDAPLSFLVENAEGTIGSGTCNSAGVLLACEATNSESKWNKFKGNWGNVRALGFPNRNVPISPDWNKKGFDASEWYDQCESRSGFHQPWIQSAFGGGAGKFWGSNKVSYFRVIPGEVIPASKKVTCSMYADDRITGVWYNDQDISHRVDGLNDGHINKVKQVTFEEVDGAILAVRAADNNNGNGDHASFFVYCTSKNPNSGWHNWYSTATNMLIRGVNDPNSIQSDWGKKAANTDSWRDNCFSAGYERTMFNYIPSHLKNAKQRGVWACGSGPRKTAFFRMSPGMSVPTLNKVTCLLTADNDIHVLKYNNVNLLDGETEGNIHHWPTKKTVRFDEVDGGVLTLLAVNSESGNHCNTGGILLACDSLNPKSDFAGWYATPSNTRALGYPNDKSIASTWTTNGFDDSQWYDQCVSRSGFHQGEIQAKKAQKLWGTYKYSYFRISPGAKIPASQAVTCSVWTSGGGRGVTSVYYNDVDITNRMVGSSHMFTIKFQEVDGAVLGFKANAAGSCFNSAVSVHCTSVRGGSSLWHNYASDRTSMIAKADPVASNWYTARLDDTEWKDVCTSSAGGNPLASRSKQKPGSAGGNGAKAIWGAAPTVFFRMRPGLEHTFDDEVTCTFTALARVRTIYYNGADITNRAYMGGLSVPHQTKTIRFTEESGAILAFDVLGNGRDGPSHMRAPHQRNKASCNGQGGFIMSCKATDVSSRWHNFITEQYNWGQIKVSGSEDGTSPPSCLGLGSCSAVNGWDSSNLCRASLGAPPHMYHPPSAGPRPWGNTLTGATSPQPIWGSFHNSWFRFNPDAEQEPTVTCKFTASEEIRQVLYNDEDITSRVVGNRNHWPSVKSVSFYNQAGASLSINVRGRGTTGAGSCGTDGLILACSSTDILSPWHNLVSTTDANSKVWATGRQDAHERPSGALWYTNDFNPRAWTNNMCKGASKGVNVGNGAAQWIWGKGRFSFFRFQPSKRRESPGTVTCKFTVDNMVDRVWYNNVDITGSVAGNRGNWPTVKTVSFTETDGAALVVQGTNAEHAPRWHRPWWMWWWRPRPYDHSRTAGFMMQCTSTDTSSKWHNLGSLPAPPFTAWAGVPSTPQRAGKAGWRNPVRSTSGFNIPIPVQKLWCAPSARTCSFRVWPY